MDVMLCIPKLPAEVGSGAMNFSAPAAVKFGAIVVVSRLEVRSTRRPRWLRWLYCRAAKWLLGQAHELVAHHTVQRLRGGILIDPWERSRS